MTYEQGQPHTVQMKNGMGTAGFVLGLIGLIFSLIPIIGVIAWPLVILGLIFSIFGIRNARKGRANNKGIAIAGVALSAIGLLMCILWTTAFAATAPPAPTAVPGAVAGSNAGTPVDTFPIGAVANLDGLEVSATTPIKGDGTLKETYCTTVTYVNGSGEDQSFNTFDWTLRDTEKVIVSSGFLGTDNHLGSGNIASGGRKTGDVCFDKQGAGTPAAVIYQRAFGQQVTFEVG